MNNPLYQVPSVVNECSSLVEFIDEHERPLIIAPITHAQKLKLGYKMVWICFVDSNHRIYVCRRASQLMMYPSYWNFSASAHVLFGESQEDAALRELHLCFCITDISLPFPTTYSLQLDGLPVFASLYMIGPITFIPECHLEYVQEGMFLDKDELTGFVSELPELLTPMLLWAVTNNILFN